MHKWKFVGAIALTLICGSAKAEFTRMPDEQVIPIIKDLGDELPNITTILERIENAKEDAFWKSKKSLRDDLNELLDEALSLILPDTFPQIKQRLQKIDSRIDTLRQHESDLKEIAETGIDIGQKGSWLDVAKDKFKSTSGIELSRTHEANDIKATARQELDQLTNEVHSRLEERNQALAEFTRALKERYGIDWKIDQARAAFVQVNGESIVEAQVVPRILFSVEARLRELQALGPDPKKARQYYGVSTLSRLVMLRMYQKHLGDYENIWLPNLDKLEEKNDHELDKLTATEASKTSNQAVIEKNITVRKRMGKAIDIYRDALISRRDATIKMYKNAEEDALVSVQTLRTLKDLETFEDIASRSLEEFTALSELQTPDLLPLENDELINQYLDLSKQVGGS